jgi:ABC-2 type transport system permease protein
MSLRRIAVLLRNEITSGASNVIFVFALLAPILISLNLSLLFGSFPDDRPSLGLVAPSDSDFSRLAAGMEAIDYSSFENEDELRAAVGAGRVDIGLVLPSGFDAAVRAGQTASAHAYLWGESLARNRIILGTTIARLTRQLAGHEAPVDLTVSTLGEEQDLLLADRLLPLVVLIAVFFGGTMVPASSLVQDKERGTLQALTVTPVTLTDVVLAKGALGVLISVIMATVTLLLNQVVFVDPLPLLLVLFLGAVMSAAFGLLLGMVVADITGLFGLVKAMGLVLYAPAIVYLFPTLPQWIARIFPTYYIIGPVIELTQGGASLADVAGDLAILAALTALLIGGLVVLARRQQLKLA